MPRCKYCNNTYSEAEMQDHTHMKHSLDLAKASALTSGEFMIIDAKPDMGEILSSVPSEIGFHFTDEKGVYTGITALSLAEFASKLATVPVNSILFHNSRGDFQKWIQGTLGDEVLANRLSLIPSGLPVEKLQMQIAKIVRNRINELGSTR